MRPRLPKENSDISKYLNRKFAKTCLITLVVAAGVSALEITVMYRYFVGRLGEVNAVLIWIILSVWPFFALGGHRYLLDTPFEGKVLKVDYTSAVETDTKFNYSMVMVRKHFVELTVEEKSGRLRSMKIKLDNVRLTLPINEGDIVRHYRGLPYPLVVGKPTLICPFCGCDNPRDAVKCLVCKHSIVHD